MGDGRLELGALLMVLVGEHPRVRGSGQQVEGQRLEPVPLRGVAEHPGEHLLGVHHLHHQAGLDARDRLAPAQPLVGREPAVGLAVPALERGEGGLGALVVPGLATRLEQRGDGAGLQPHRHVHAVGAVLEESRRAGDQLGGEVLVPVEGLGEHELEQVHEPVLAGAVVEPGDGQREVGAAHLTPAAERSLRQMGAQVLAPAQQEGHHALVVGRLGVLDQHLRGDHARPPVLVPARAEGAGVLLAERHLGGEHPFDPGARRGEQRLVAEHVRERHEAVEIVGAALPALAVPAQPAAVRADVGPHLRELPGDAVGLEAQLALEPAAGPDLPQRQRLGSLPQRAGGRRGGGVSAHRDHAR